MEVLKWDGSRVNRYIHQFCLSKPILNIEVKGVYSMVNK